MTADQADALYTTLLAAWPYPQQPKLTGEVFKSKLVRLPDLDVARETVELLTDKADRFPIWPVFRREYAAIARRKTEELARRRGLEEPPADFAFQAAKARELLERLRTRGWDNAA
jgi:hypothetical protein